MANVSTQEGLFVFRFFDQWAVPIATGLIIVLGSAVLVILLMYFISVWMHKREQAYVERNLGKWQKLVNGLFAGSVKIKENELPKRERRYIRDLLITNFFDREFECSWDAEKQADAFAELRLIPSCSDIVRSIYIDLGFYADDLRELESRRWWRRLKAAERIEETGLKEAEDRLIELVEAKDAEVRFAALRALVASGSKLFSERVPEIFSLHSSWSYLYLVNILYSSGVPVKVLKNLAASADSNKRKAAAILAGRSNDDEVLPLLVKLSRDESEDVRSQAVYGLARTGSVAAIPVFWRMLEDPSTEVRIAIAKGIGELDYLMLLGKLVDDIEFDVRFQAFASLASLGQLGRESIRNYHGRHSDLADEFLSGV